MDVNRSSVDHGPALDRIAIQWVLGPDRASRDRSIAGHLSVESMISLHEKRSISRSADSRRIFRDGVKHRLDVGWRARDHA